MRPDDARGSTSGPEPGTPRPWAGVVLVCLGALAFALFCHFPLVHSDGSIDVDALKSVPRPVEFIIFDHTTYLAIARNAETGVSVFTEPFTGTGSSIYTSGYYWAIGTAADLTGSEVVAPWNVFGILTALALVAMCAGWARWAAPGSRAWLLAPLPLFVGTLAWWVNDSWLGLFRQTAVVLWAPYALIAMGTAESFGVLLMGLCLLALCAALTAAGRRRLVLAAVAGGLLGLLFHVHAYVAIFTSVMVVALSLAEDRLRDSSRRRLAVDAGVLLVVLVALRAVGDGVQSTTKMLLLVAVAVGLLVARRSWWARMGGAAAALVVPAVLIMAPMGIRLARDAADENGFLTQRQAQNGVRDLTLPLSSVLWHELPVIVLAVAAIAGLWRVRRESERAAVWLAALIATAAVTILMTFNDTWGVNQEPYRFLPYGALLLAILGLPWLWVALSRRRPRGSALEIAACVLLLATVPTTLAYLDGMDAAAPLLDDPNIRATNERIAAVTHDEITLLDSCFNAELTRARGGPHIPKYHAGLAYPDNRAAIDRALGLRDRAALADGAALQAAGIRWFATHTNCAGIPPARIRAVLGRPVAVFPMPEPERYGHPAGTRYEVFRVPAA